MKRAAVIIPEFNDANRGDQALGWESARFLKEYFNIENIMFIGGDIRERKLFQQTMGQGYKILTGIISHPRRGTFRDEDKIKESKISLLRMLIYACYDFLYSAVILLLATTRLINIILNRNKKDTLEAFRRADLVAVKGGGFMHAYGGITAFYYIWYQLFYIRLAKRLDKRVVVLPNSFGPFKGFLVERQLRKVLASCEFISARESISKEMISELLKREVLLSPDMGFYLEGENSNYGKALCRQHSIPLEELQCIGLTLRPYRFPGEPNPQRLYNKYIHSFADFVEYIHKKGYHPVLITHVFGPSAHENDSLALKDLIYILDKNIEYSLIEFKGNCREIKALYGCMSYIVGTRFHSIIFAMDYGIPCLAIAYGGNKAYGIMRDIGIEDMVIPIEKVTGDMLCNKFELMLAEESRIKQRIREYISRLPNERDNLFKSMMLSLNTDG